MATNNAPWIHPSITGMAEPATEVRWRAGVLAAGAANVRELGDEDGTRYTLGDVRRVELEALERYAASLEAAREGLRHAHSMLSEEGKTLERTAAALKRKAEELDKREQGLERHAQRIREWEASHAAPPILSPHVPEADVVWDGPEMLPKVKVTRGSHCYLCDEGFGLAEEGVVWSPRSKCEGRRLFHQSCWRWYSSAVAPSRPWGPPGWVRDLFYGSLFATWWLAIWWLIERSPWW